MAEGLSRFQAGDGDQRRQPGRRAIEALALTSMGPVLGLSCDLSHAVWGRLCPPPVKIHALSPGRLPPGQRRRNAAHHRPPRLPGQILVKAVECPEDPS